MLRLRTLGGLSVENAIFIAGAAARRRPLALLALLAVAGRRGLSREKIVGLLWPESDEERGRNSLSQAISALRRELGANDVVIGSVEIRLNPDVISSDVEEFERALAAGELERAAALYVGPFLDGVFIKDAAEFEHWSTGERARLQHLQLDALERLAVAASERDDHHASVGYWRQLAALEPTNARAAVGLMEALVAFGDRAGALGHFRLYEKLLQEEHGCTPEPAVQKLAARLRAAVASTPALVSTAPPQPNDSAMVAVTDSGIASSQWPSLSTPVSAPAKSPYLRERYTLSALGVVAVIGVVAIGLSRARASDAEVDAKRVVVAPFDNLSGDSSLAALSPIVANWVTDGLSRTGLVRVVDPGTTLAAARNVAGSTHTGSASLRAFGEEAGAGLIVAGAYHVTADSLCIRSRIVESRTGEVLRALGSVCGSSHARMAVVHELRTRVMGGLASIVDPRLASVTGAGSPPPNYEAYRAYVEGLELFSRGGGRYAAAIGRFHTAVRLDSTFVLPLIWMAHAYYNTGNSGTYDSLLSVLTVRREGLAPAEQRGLDALVAKRRNDVNGELTALREAAALAPQSNWAYMLGARLSSAGKMREAVEELSHIDPYRGWVRGWRGYWLTLTTAYHTLGDYRSELAVIRKAKGRLPSNAFLQGFELKALASLGRVKDVDRIVDAIVAAPSDSLGPGPAELMEAAAIEYYAHGFPAAGRAIASRCAQWRGYPAYGGQSGRTVRRADCFYLAGQAVVAESLYRQVVAGGWWSANDVDRYNETVARTRIAILAVRRGDRAEALRLSAMLDSLPHPAFLAQAQIAVALGDRARAVSLLRHGEEGLTPSRWFLEHEIDFAPLRGYGPFETLVSPNEEPGWRTVVDGVKRLARR